MPRRVVAAVTLALALSGCSIGSSSSLPPLDPGAHSSTLSPDACDAATVAGVEKVVAEQLAAFKARDFARAFALSSSQFQAISSVSDLKALIDDGRHAEVLDSVGYAMTECRIAGPGQAMGAVDVTGANGRTVALAYQFVMEDGSWSILMSRPMGTSGTNPSPGGVQPA